MKITFDTKAGDILANAILEVVSLIETGDISVGPLGISPDSAKYLEIFYKAIQNPPEVKEVIITDEGLKLTPTNPN